MTDNTARRSRRKPFVPSGTPWQQDAWTRKIERHLEREARTERRKAARLERLSAAIAARRAEGKPIDASHLCDVINAGVAPFATHRLAGVDSGMTRSKILDKVLDIKPFPPHLAHLQRREEPELAAGPSVPATTLDALSQAVAIARSASGDDVDWSREPLTDREAKLRRVWLERQLEAVHDGGYFAISAAVLRVPFGKCPPDLRAADEEAKGLVKARRAEEHRAEFRDLADELDDEEGDES